MCAFFPLAPVCTLLRCPTIFVCNNGRFACCVQRLYPFAFLWGVPCGGQPSKRRPWPWTTPSASAVSMELEVCLFPDGALVEAPGVFGTLFAYLSDFILHFARLNCMCMLWQLYARCTWYIVTLQNVLLEWFNKNGMVFFLFSFSKNKLYQTVISNHFDTVLLSHNFPKQNLSCVEDSKLDVKHSLPEAIGLVKESFSKWVNFAVARSLTSQAELEELCTCSQARLTAVTVLAPYLSLNELPEFKAEVADWPNGWKLPPFSWKLILFAH